MEDLILTNVFIFISMQVYDTTKMTYDDNILNCKLYNLMLAKF